MIENSAIKHEKPGQSKPVLSTPPLFDHERLDVYQLELLFIAWVADLLDEVSKQAKGKTAEVCDQLDRASLSALLNTAEGNGKRQRQVRAKFFDDARGSATECAACLDAIVAKRCATEARVREGKALLVRIVSILCKLVERIESAGQLREEAEELQPRFQPAPEPVSYRRKPRTRTRTRTRTKI
jgi:four helix bundle protein